MTGAAHLNRFERCYLLLLGLLALYPTGVLLLWIVRAIPFRYGLDYNEGIVWQQMNDIVAGRGYAPITGFPAIVFHYPPVYHLLSAAVASLGIDPLSSGRMVSASFTLVSAVMIGLLTARWFDRDTSRVERIVGCAAAIFCFLGCQGVQEWAPLMRVDPTACGFAMLGLWLIVRSAGKPRLVYAAAFILVLSVFTKQNSVLTAVAGFGSLLWWRPKTALRGIATSIALGTVAAATLLWMTHGDAYRHIVLYNINRFSLARILPNLRDGTTISDRALIVLGVLGFLSVLVRDGFRRAPDINDETAVARYATLSFALLATLSLVSTAKYGSSSAYYMQWEAAIAIFGGVGVLRLLGSARRRYLSGHRHAAIVLAAAPILLATWVAGTTSRGLISNERHFDRQDRILAALIAPIKGPVISTEMVLLLRDHRRVLWEPAIFRELAYAGRWDERVLVNLILQHRIAAILTDGDRGFRWFDEQFSPAIADAMDEALPRRIHVGIRVLHLPGAPADITFPLTNTPATASPDPSKIGVPFEHRATHEAKTQER
jgi:hypothetical protein